MATKKSADVWDPYKTLLAIRKKLSHLTLEKAPIDWLDTGVPELNAVFGRRARGIPCGRLLELYGMESNGKTALALWLAGVAQRKGYLVLWLDFESSFDPEWAEKRGLDWKKVILLQPYVGKFGKKSESATRLCTAPELCKEAEELLIQYKLRDPKGRVFLVLDSITSMLTGAEAELGLTADKLPSKMSLPAFLGKLLRRWVGFAHSQSVTMLFINQMRTNPMQLFGDPNYTPGGNAPKFYCHVRVRIRKVSGKSGFIRDKSKVVGVKGVLSNTKNKSGGRPFKECGFHIRFNGASKFMTASEIKKV